MERVAADVGRLQAHLKKFDDQENRNRKSAEPESWSCKRRPIRGEGVHEFPGEPERGVNGGRILILVWGGPYHACFVVLIALFMPRLAIFLIWIFNRLRQSYETRLWPFLGFLFMRIRRSATWLGLSITTGNHRGWLFLVIICALTDLGAWGGTKKREEVDISEGVAPANALNPFATGPPGKNRGVPAGHQGRHGSVSSTLTSVNNAEATCAEFARRRHEPDGYIAGPKGEADWIIMDRSCDFEP